MKRGEAPPDTPTHPPTPTEQTAPPHPHSPLLLQARAWPPWRAGARPPRRACRSLQPAGRCRRARVEAPPLPARRPPGSAVRLWAWQRLPSPTTCARLCRLALQHPTTRARWVLDRKEAALARQLERHALGAHEASRTFRSCSKIKSKRSWLVQSVTTPGSTPHPPTTACPTRGTAAALAI